MSDSIALEARAKLNLLLRVLAREESGYHSVETLYARVDLADRLIAARTEGGVTLQVSGEDAGPAEQNLARQAARLVLQAIGGRFGVALTLEKRIPVAAGLGGGSADAAAALQAVNALAGNAVPRHELFQFAARLGADVPFCFSGARFALGWGHGERLLEIPGPPAAPGLIVAPPVAVPTAHAYRWVDETREGAGPRGAVALDLESLGAWGSIGRMAGNDFEVPVFGHHPELRAAYEALAATHPLLCRMSGSGAAVFAVYRSTGDRDDAGDRMGRKYGRVFPVEVGSGG